MFHTRTLKNQKGFSLMESILTTVVLAFGFMGGMTVLENATANTLQTDFMTISTEYANEKLESIMADKEFIGFNEITEDNYPAEVLDDAYSLNRSVTVTEVSSSDLETPQSGSGLKKVEVTVSWGSGSTNESSTVSTLVANY